MNGLVQLVSRSGANRQGARAATSRPGSAAAGRGVQREQARRASVAAGTPEGDDDVPRMQHTEARGRTALYALVDSGDDKFGFAVNDTGRHSTPFLTPNTCCEHVRVI